MKLCDHFFNAASFLRQEYTGNIFWCLMGGILKLETFVWTSLNAETHLSAGFGKFHRGEIRRYCWGWSYQQTTRKDLKFKLRGSRLPMQVESRELAVREIC